MDPFGLPATSGCPAYAACTERGLVDCRRALLEQLTGEAGPLVVSVVREADYNPTPNVVPGDLTDMGAPVHRALGLIIGLELRRLRIVHHPPKELVALESSHDARLGETMGHRFLLIHSDLNAHTSCPATTPPIDRASTPED